ncbi:MAG: hypothetical protein H0U13_16430 [Gemmatimonadaceae bacterium]|nr:hypothetical protein [Gemmatimonadaceae bacterium]
MGRRQHVAEPLVADVELSAQFGARGAVARASVWMTACSRSSGIGGSGELEMDIVIIHDKGEQEGRSRRSACSARASYS